MSGFNELLSEVCSYSLGLLFMYSLLVTFNLQISKDNVGKICIHLQICWG